MLKGKEDEFWEESTEDTEAHDAIMRLKKKLGYLPDVVEVYLDGETWIAREVKQNGVTEKI